LPALTLTFSAIVLALFASLAWGDISGGSKRVLLETAVGESVELGRLDISRDGGGRWRFEFSLEETNFSDQFLSMRPFKCIDGQPMYCHLTYPYDKGHSFGIGDFVDLEYEFLFIVRAPDEYGIDPYNGRYYVIREEDGMLVGEPRAVDLNLLAAPPEAGVIHPIGEAELDIIEIEAERFPRLLIR
jgi:hypothetical protein